jgi:hypothetical protein
VKDIAKITVHEIISGLYFHKMVASLENLYHNQVDGESFMENIITGDEAWVYKFTPK